MRIKIFFLSVNVIIAIYIADAQSKNKNPNVREVEISGTDTLIDFDHQAGFYSSTFSLKLTAPLSSDSIIYTLDGSNPFNRGTYFKALHSITITIDPDNTNGRGKTPAVIVKACIVRNGVSQPHPISKSFIFINKVLTQKYPGGSWPNASINAQMLDYEMDQEVVTDPLYADLMSTALLNFPSISISTDMKNLFDKSKGIYVNARSHGSAWERE
jgi:hypothetical protein